MKICVPLMEKTVDIVLEKMETAVQNGADIVEIWAGEIFSNAGDFAENGDEILNKIFAQKKKLGNIPLFFNVKTPTEKGNFLGDDAEKTQILCEILKKGAEMIDVDYGFEPEFLEKIKQTKTPDQILVLSAHFFDGTPSFPSLKNRIQIMQNRGADMVKIAAIPEVPKDLVIMLRLAENLKRQNIPFIALSMGQMGKISRILCPFLGGEMTFAPLDEKTASAPGQMPMEQMRMLEKIFQLKDK